MGSPLPLPFCLSFVTWCGPQCPASSCAPSPSPGLVPMGLCVASDQPPESLSPCPERAGPPRGVHAWRVGLWGWRCSALHSRTCSPGTGVFPLLSESVLFRLKALSTVSLPAAWAQGSSPCWVPGSLVHLHSLARATPSACCPGRPAVRCVASVVGVFVPTFPPAPPPACIFLQSWLPPTCLLSSSGSDAVRLQANCIHCSDLSVLMLCIYCFKRADLRILL